jgi:sporulation protein YlmC with PRC-barrel domain
MKSENTLNLAQAIKGMPVLMLQRGARLGTIVDAIVHPTEGLVQGFVLVNGAGQERLLRATDCLVYREPGVVVVTPDAWDEMEQTPAPLVLGVRVCETLLDVEVITNRGRSLGRVVEVYATEEELRTIYRVATYRWRFFVRGGFFLPGTLPVAWLERGARLIVPADAMERESFSSLADALRMV